MVAYVMLYRPYMAKTWRHYRTHVDVTRSALDTEVESFRKAADCGDQSTGLDTVPVTGLVLGFDPVPSHFMWPFGHCNKRVIEFLKTLLQSNGDFMVPPGEAETAGFVVWEGKIQPAQEAP